MGTNYYLRRIPTEEDYNKIVYYAVKRDIYDDYDRENLFSIIHNLNRHIHLCKTSCGWYPLFEHHHYHSLNFLLLKSYHLTIIRFYLNL